jgi:hypothetical protein
VIRLPVIPWSYLLGGLILVIMLVPIRRYTLPANLPFQLELYRLFVAALVVGWVASLLVDHRVRLRRTGFSSSSGARSRRSSSTPNGSRGPPPRSTRR